VPSTTLRLVRRDAAPFTLVTVLIEATGRPSIEALTVRCDGTSIERLLGFAWPSATSAIPSSLDRRHRAMICG